MANREPGHSDEFPAQEHHDHFHEEFEESFRQPKPELQGKFSSMPDNEHLLEKEPVHGRKNVSGYKGELSGGPQESSWFDFSFGTQLLIIFLMLTIVGVGIYMINALIDTFGGYLQDDL